MRFQIATPSDVHYQPHSGVLDKYKTTWSKRAQVRKEYLFEHVPYELSKPDFLVSLTPLSCSSVYDQLPQAKQQRLLTNAWIAYHLKTIAIESKIISPVCYKIIDGQVPGANTPLFQKLIAQTLVDESYHILLSQHAIETTALKRSLDLTFEYQFDLLAAVSRLSVSYTEHWQQSLIQLAVAIVSEVFISDYLKEMSRSDKVVSFNREVVNTHRLDEIAHGAVFVDLIKSVFNQLSDTEQNFFLHVLPYPVVYFASLDLSFWKQSLYSICPDLAPAILSDIHRAKPQNLFNLDYTNLCSLADELGMTTFNEQVEAILASAA